MLRTIADIGKKLEKRKQKVTLVATAVQDENVLKAVLEARDRDVVDILLIGNEQKIRQMAETSGADLSGISIINEEDDYKAGIDSVKLVHDNRAHILMNGQENYHGYAVLGRAVIDREYGIRRGQRISHFALFELESYHKLIGITDCVMNVNPDLKTKAAIISNAVFFMRVLGVENPKVAVLAAVEVVNESMPVTMEAAMLSKMAQRGQIKNCTVEGPLAFDNAISKEHAIHKGIVNDVSGDPDILLAPDVETAGMIYQSFVFFSKAKVASLALGATVPIVLTSKLDSHETRVNSILLAASLYA